MKSKPRIALLTQDLSRGGGTATLTAFVDRIIRDSGNYDVDVISLATSSRDETSVRITSPASWLRGVRVVQRDWHGRSYQHVGARWAELEHKRYQRRPELDRLLKAYDLIQVSVGTPAWAKAALDVGPPVMLFTATTVRLEREAVLTQGGARGIWRRRMTDVNERIEHEILPQLACVFAESDYTLDNLRPYVAPDRLELGLPGIDTDFFSPAPVRQRGFIIAVGRMADPRKNVRLLLEAYARLRERQPDAPRLVLVGEAPAEHDMHYITSAGLAGCVEIRTNVPLSDLADLYRAAGFLVLPSDEEGLGFVVLEAMASGIPVVSTMCGGPISAVLDGETGFLTPVGDREAMANAMSALANDFDMNVAFGKAARTHAVNKFSLPVTGRVFLERYASALGVTAPHAKAVGY